MHRRWNALYVWCSNAQCLRSIILASAEQCVCKPTPCSTDMLAGSADMSRGEVDDLVASMDYHWGGAPLVPSRPTPGGAYSNRCCHLWLCAAAHHHATCHLSKATACC